MDTGKDKLATDLQIVEQMVAKMEDYLADDTLFWQKLDDDLVQPTVGGYWLREHRLLDLHRSLLDDAQQDLLEKMVEKFNKLYRDNPERVINKATQELDARLNQWQQALKDLLDDDPPSMAYYRSDIEFRTIIELIINKLKAAAATVDSKFMDRLNKLDKQLKEHWQPGAFVWPDTWQPAYPKNTFWWLYGSLD